DVSDGPAQVAAGGGWILGMPIRIAASPREITGVLWFARADRSFEDDEVALTAELIGKVELSAAEIVAHHAIREQALTDPLTGLGNRRQLTADLRAAFEERTETAGASLLLLFDLDGFKAYNDTFGHLAGDELLARLGERLRR